MKESQTILNDINNILKELDNRYHQIRKLKKEVEALKSKVDEKINFLCQKYNYIKDYLLIFSSLDDAIIRYYVGDKDINKVYAVCLNKGDNIKVWIKDFQNNEIDITNKIVEVIPLIEEGYLIFHVIGNDEKLTTPTFYIFIKE